ncbi:MAG: nitrile hydratase subunit alpha [Rhodospirillaceae bacterium]|nr:nitrile hydratase subunit alpha [Rhodospirillaceae bacterium]
MHGDDLHHHHDEDPHAPIENKDDLGHYALMTLAVRDLLVEKGVFSADDVRATVEAMDARSPAQGARIVARAWTDPNYKARLLADGSAGAKELGIDVGPTHLVVVENTDSVHNLIVCTLCSCYPRWVLGLPPDWYKSRSYRSRAVREPRAVLAEFGTAVPDDVTVRVHDSTADMRYLVLPRRPQGTEGWSEDQLAAIATRDSMIGVTVPKVTA